MGSHIGTYGENRSMEGENEARGQRTVYTVRRSKIGEIIKVWTGGYSGAQSQWILWILVRQFSILTINLPFA